MGSRAFRKTPTQEFPAGLFKNQRPDCRWEGMESVGLARDERLQCSKCGRPASFLSPIGFFCPTDALISAAFHDWIPVRLQLSPRESTDDGADLSRSVPEPS